MDRMGRNPTLICSLSKQKSCSSCSSCQRQHSGVSVHVGLKINLQPRTAFGFPRQRESQLRSGLCLEIRRRVMQPHHRRRVDVVRRTDEAVSHQHIRVRRVLFPTTPKLSWKVSIAAPRQCCCRHHSRLIKTSSSCSAPASGQPPHPNSYP